jgi:hypothetical protein
MKYGANLSEEEKQYIASMAQMNEGGEYTIKVRDEQGKEVNRKLTELSEAQLKTAIEAQKNAPKSMEDIARAQMQTSDVIAGDVNAIRQKVVQGISVAQPLRDLPEQTRALTTAATDAIVKLIPNADKIQGGTEKAISYLKDTIQDVVTGKKSLDSVAGEMKSGLKSMGYDIVGVFEKVPEVLTQSVTKNLQGKQDPFSKEAYQALTTGKGQEKFQDILKQYTSSQGLTKQIEQTKKTTGITEKKEVTHTGNINIIVDVQGDTNDPEFLKKFQKIMDDQKFKDYIVKTATGTKDATGQTVHMKIK